MLLLQWEYAPVGNICVDIIILLHTTVIRTSSTSTSKYSVVSGTSGRSKNPPKRLRLTEPWKSCASKAPSAPFAGSSSLKLHTTRAVLGYREMTINAAFEKLINYGAHDKKEQSTTGLNNSYFNME